MSVIYKFHPESGHLCTTCAGNVTFTEVPGQPVIGLVRARVASKCFEAVHRLRRGAAVRIATWPPGI